jgi:hypothetical protein
LPSSFSFLQQQQQKSLWSCAATQTLVELRRSADSCGVALQGSEEGDAAVVAFFFL